MAERVTVYDPALEHQVTVRFERTGGDHPINQWLQSPDTKGRYGRAFWDKGEYTELRVWFSDPNTAFEFKMRFG